MSYWLTIQWPLTTDENRHKSHSGVWLPEGKEAAGQGLATGDQVFIYETKTGRPRKDGLDYWTGKMGVVNLVKVVSVNLNHGFATSDERYADGGEMLWKLVARTEPSDRTGFCSREIVCNCLHYSRNYYFRGFGKLHSGLLEITEEEFNCILRNLRQ